MNHEEKEVSTWGSYVWLVLLATFCFLLIAYVVSSQTASVFNMVVIALIVAACPLMHFLVHGRGHGRH
jgi:hypothetical protein